MVKSQCRMGQFGLEQSVNRDNQKEQAVSGLEWFGVRSQESHVKGETASGLWQAKLNNQE